MKYGGKTMKVSTWSGGYSIQFCAAIIKGATNALQRIFTRQTYPADAPATTADDDMSEAGHDDASARLSEKGLSRQTKSIRGMQPMRQTSARLKKTL